jgi:hypothetical protein
MAASMSVMWMPAMEQRVLEVEANHTGLRKPFAVCMQADA